MYDFIIIGSGISGLYFAYKYLAGKYNFLILDKRDYIGGRAQSINFHDININLGAGIIEDSNPNLLKLLGELKIPYKSFNSEFTHEYKSLTENDVDNILNQIKEVYEKNKNEITQLKLSFNEFLNIYFPNEFVVTFKHISDYNDFYDADVNTVINLYPYADLITKTAKMYSIEGGWIKLINTLTDSIGKHNIKLNNKVTYIIKNNNIFTIKTPNNEYQSKKIIICSDLDVTKIHFDGIIGINDFFNNIGSVPFIRIYSYHDNINIKNSIRTTGPLDKIIPISKNILMSEYLDNENALFFHNLMKK